MNQLNSLKFFFCLTFLSFLVSSCYYNKRLVYLQDSHFSESKPTLVESKRTPYQLQPSDILSVQIKSSAEKEVSGIFNISTQNLMMANPGTLFLEGYSIDASRKITLPILGELMVKGYFDAARISKSPDYWRVDMIYFRSDVIAPTT